VVQKRSSIILTLEAEGNPVLVVVVTELIVAAAPGLLVAQATHLLSLDLLFIIQVGHSHDPAAGLNCDSNDD